MNFSTYSTFIKLFHRFKGPQTVIKIMIALNTNPFVDFGSERKIVRIRY